MAQSCQGFAQLWCTLTQGAGSSLSQRGATAPSHGDGSSPQAQSWDQSIKERAAGEETAESRRALKLCRQPGVTPQHCPHNTHALHCSRLEGCNNSEAAESMGLISHQCPSDAGRKGCELGSQQTVGGRKEGGRKGGRCGLGGLGLCICLRLVRGPCLG